MKPGQDSSASSLRCIETAQRARGRRDLHALEPVRDKPASVAQYLQRHPLIGRPVESDLPELIISRGRSGYAALYSFEEHQDAVLILSLRHQREAGLVWQDED